MNLRHIRITFLLVGVLIITSAIFASATFATPHVVSRPSEGSCSGDTCSGYDIGGGGTHIAGNGGSGSLAGYTHIRLDAYRPAPNLEECTTPNRSTFSNLGIPRDADGPFYVHYRVALARSDNATVLGGVPGSVYWDSGLDWNADTGATRPSQNLTKAPTHADPWVGPRWQAPRTYCLPLTAGNNVDAQLAAAKPQVEFKPENKAVVGMKKSTMTVSVTEASQQGLISIGFTFKDYVFLAARVTEKDGATVNKFFDVTKSGSPIYIKKKSKTEDSSSNEIVYDVKFKKKGTYKIIAVANFNGQVLINGALVTSGGVSTVSEISNINVIDIKSINRKN